jgi:serine/threonine-protein kinase RsbW
MERESWLPAAPESASQARAIMREVASELQLDGATTWELTLATSEAFANAVQHGDSHDPRGIFLRVESGDGRVGVEVRDFAGGFGGEPSSPRLRGEGGRSMPIIAAIMDHLEVVPGSDANRVRFGKQLELV